MSKVTTSSGHKVPRHHKTRPNSRRQPRNPADSYGHHHSTAYPRGVSSYLSTFLNDEANDSDDEKSLSDSDGSFYSYSARLDIMHAYGDGLDAPYLSTSSLESFLHRNSNPSSAESFQHRRPSEDVQTTLLVEGLGQLKRKGSISTKTSMKTHNSQISKHHVNSTIRRRKSSSRSNSVAGELPMLSTSVNYIAPSGKETRQKIPPKVCDVGVQTIDSSFSINSHVCPYCHCEPQSNDSQRSPALSDSLNSIEATNSGPRPRSRANSGPISPRAIVPPKEMQPPEVRRNTSSDESSMFQTSDPLPDRVSRLFDRASFWVMNENTPSNSPPLPPREIDDPDGLRKNLSALLEGHSTEESVTKDSIADPLATPLPERAHLSISSISGIQFSDPFTSKNTSSPRSPIGTQPENKKLISKASKLEAAWRRSSLHKKRDDVPPVPPIPEAFLPFTTLDSRTRLSSISVPAMPSVEARTVDSNHPALGRSLSLSDGQQSATENLSELLAVYHSDPRMDEEHSLVLSDDTLIPKSEHGIPVEDWSSSDMRAIVRPHSPSHASTVISLPSRGSLEIKQVKPESRRPVIHHPAVASALRLYEGANVGVPASQTSQYDNQLSNISQTPRRSSTWSRLLMPGRARALSPTKVGQKATRPQRKLQRRQSRRKTAETL